MLKNAIAVVIWDKEMYRKNTSEYILNINMS